MHISLVTLYEILLDWRFQFFYYNHILKSYQILNQLFPLLRYELMYVKAIQVVLYEVAELSTVVTAVQGEESDLLSYVNVHRDSEGLEQRQRLRFGRSRCGESQRSTNYSEQSWMGGRNSRRERQYKALQGLEGLIGQLDLVNPLSGTIPGLWICAGRSFIGYSSDLALDICPKSISEFHH